MALGVYRTEAGTRLCRGRSSFSDRPWAGDPQHFLRQRVFGTLPRPQVLTRRSPVTSELGSWIPQEEGLQAPFLPQRLGEGDDVGESRTSGMWRVRVLESDSRCWEPQDVLGSHCFRVLLDPDTILMDGRHKDCHEFKASLDYIMLLF